MNLTLRMETWFLRIISLLGAASLWFYVVNSEPIEIEHKLPLKIQTVSGFAQANIVPTEIKVRFKGPRTFMKNIGQSRAPVKVKVVLLPVLETGTGSAILISIPVFPKVRLPGQTNSPSFCLSLSPAPDTCRNGGPAPGFQRTAIVETL